MDSLADAIAGRHSLRDMLCLAYRLTTACAAHGGGAERLGRIKIKRTTVERLASLVLLSGRDYFRRSCGGYITKSLAVSICGCRPVILVSVVSAPNGNFPRGLRWLLNLLHLQAGITLLLLPLQVALFHGISVTAMLANLLPYLGHICDGSTHPGGNDSAFNRAVFS